MKSTLTLLAFSLILTFSGTIAAQYTADSTSYPEMVIEHMEKQIPKLMRRYNVIGLSIALVDDQQTIWLRGFGYEDKARFIPATKETTYRIGSISKLFTATAVMQLVEKGLVHLDSSYSTYVPEFDIQSRFDSVQEITPRMLMTHHSGIPGDLFHGLLCEEAAPYTSIIEELKDEYTAYPPETIFSYSNIGASLLGYLVEKVSGKDFISYVDESVLRPLGMERSSFGMSQKVQQSYSKGYKRGRERKDPEIRELPAGLMNSSAGDMTRFIKMVFAGGTLQDSMILAKETIEKMMTPQNEGVALDKDFRIGLGWWLWNGHLNYAGKFAGHGGDTEVFHAALGTLPEHKLGVIVLTNSVSGAAIASAIAEKTLELALKYKKNLEKPVEPPAKIIRKGTKNYSNIAGLWATPNGIVEITDKKNKLYINLENRSMRIFPNTKGSFTPRLKLFGFIPVTLFQQEMDFDTIDEKEVMYAYSFPVGEKVVKEEIPEAWKNRVGKYKLLNKDKDREYFQNTELYISGGFLKLRALYFGQYHEVVLKALNDTDAITLGLGRGTHETVQVTKGEDGKEVLEYSGYKLSLVPPNKK